MVTAFSIGKRLLTPKPDKAVSEKVLKEMESVEKAMSEADVPQASKDAHPTTNLEAQDTSEKIEPQKPEKEPVKVVKVAKVMPEKPVAKQEVSKPVSTKPSSKKQEPVAQIASKSDQVTEKQPVKLVKKAPVAKKSEFQQASKHSTSKVPYKLIAGSFDTHVGAIRLQNKLKAQHIDSYYWHTENKHYIQVGAFATEKEAIKYASILKKEGFSAVVLKK
jgi:cell division protein FtsN